MSQLQDRIYSNDYADIILPYTYTTPEYFLQYFERFSPQIINDTFALIRIPVHSEFETDPTRFVYSIIPNLYVPLDFTSLENTGILSVQTQPFLNLSGKDAYSLMLKDYPDVMNIEEMCSALGICTKTGYRLLKDGSIQGRKVGGKYRIPKIHLLSYLKVCDLAG